MQCLCNPLLLAIAVKQQPARNCLALLHAGCVSPQKRSCRSDLRAAAPVPGARTNTPHCAVRVPTLTGLACRALAYKLRTVCPACSCAILFRACCCSISHGENKPSQTKLYNRQLNMRTIASEATHTSSTTASWMHRCVSSGGLPTNHLEAGIAIELSASV